MRMLNVSYIKAKAMLNKCKVEMLSLGYGNVRARLRQNCSLSPTSVRTNSDSRAGQGFTYMGAGKLGAESWNNEALLNLC